MHIHYFHDEKYPSKGTDTQQVMKNLEGLSRTGPGVSLHIPRFPDTWLRSTGDWRRELYDFYGIRHPFDVKGVWCPIPYSRLRLEKLFHGLVSPAVATGRRPEIIYSRNVPPVLCGLRLGHYALYETYKPLPTSMPGLWRLLRVALSSPRFLGIITHSEYAREVFIRHRVPDEKVVAIHNGFDPEEMEPRLTPQEARRKLGLPESGGPIIGYAGNMQASKNLPSLLEVVGRVPNARLLLVGGARSHREELAAQAAQKAPGRVIFAGWVEGYRVPQYLYACDILAIPPSGRAARRGDTVLPMKLFQYLAAGRALFVPDLPDTAELVRDGVHGVRTPPDASVANVRDLARLVSDREAARLMGRNCARLAARFTWESRARRIVSFIQDNMRP